MSLTFGFYNSLDGDRTYDAIQMSSIFDGVISDGIFATIGDAFAVTSISGDIIGIGSGRAWFDHTWTLNSDRHVMTLGPSEVIGDRIDAVVLEVNELLRANRFLVLEGEPTTETPSRPELTNTDKIHQHILAYIYRTGAAESITQSDITNMIGTSATPFVTGIIDTVDVDQLLAQWDSQFGDWFDEMKDQLSTDAAGHLQNQIGNLNNLTTEAKNNLVSAINEAASTGGGGSVTAEDVGTGQYEEPLIQISEGGTGARTASDALANLGLTLPVLIENGGTGADNAISALANLGIVDYVVERGTNYMKYANGLMIQWGTHTPASTAMSAMGNIYVSAWITITYPQPFVTFLGGALCKCDATANTGIYNVSWQTTNVQYTAFRADANYSGTHSASWVAFGTWK